MSRIEEALEKAALLRKTLEGSTTGGTVQPAPRRPASSIPSYPVSPSPAAEIGNPLLVTVTDPHSPIAEEYRKLKTLLVTLTKQETFANTVMVTSTVGSEGKSLTALNLAISLAQEFDHTVLLVDADLRKPSLHSYLGIDSPRGLSDCLVNGGDIAEILVRTGIGKLTLLPAGKPVRNPAELFSSQNMADMIAEMKNRYPDRYIIIDTPPVLPFAETHSLGRLVDGVVFVVREGAAAMPDITEALHNLKGARILGMVYNEASSAALNGRYSYYYHGYSGSPAGEAEPPRKKGLWGRLSGEAMKRV